MGLETVSYLGHTVNASNIFTTVLSVTLLYYFSVGIYRLFLCPIAHVPGPLFARLTYWYEFYYDVIQPGQYTFQLPKLHEKYGPIIRINPSEVHVADPDFYDTLYPGPGKRRNKWAWFTNAFGIPQSIFGTIEHDRHRARRAPLNPFFSKAKVRSLQPRIEEVVTKLLGRFTDFRSTGEPMTVSVAFAAVANDIAMRYAFGRDENRTQAPDFAPDFLNATVAGTSMSHFLKQFPWVMSIMQSLPDWVAVKLDPNTGSYVRLQSGIRKQIAIIETNPQSLKSSSQGSRETIFHHILNSDLPPAEKSTARLWQDGQVVVLAGTITTAAALSWATFHLLDQPKLLRQLKDELRPAMPDPTTFPPLTVLEQLPCLTGVIKEALRLSNGVVHRLNRISPDEPVVFKDTRTQKAWAIPPGTPMSMTGYLIHMDPAVFENPAAFNPQRWLDNPRLDKYLVPFSRGTRQCLGMNLGYAELYLTLAAIFSRYGSKEVRFENDEGYLELYQTDYRDVEIVGDSVIPVMYKESKGVRIVVREVWE